MEAVFRRQTLASAESRSGASCKLSYSTLFWLFLVGSIVGFLLEGFWCVLTKGHWENHSAVVWGPFCIIYGIGAAAVYLLSILLKNRRLPVQFAAFTVSGAAVEYFGSLFQELCFGSVSWDYSDHLFNLGGRVSLRMALLWGVLGLLFMRFVFPAVSRLFGRMEGNGWRIACAGMTVFMAANLLVTSAAISRWHSRMTATDPPGPVAQWLDSTYDDQTMEKLFPNMQFGERGSGDSADA